MRHKRGTLAPQRTVSTHDGWEWTRWTSHAVRDGCWVALEMRVRGRAPDGTVYLDVGFAMKLLDKLYFVPPPAPLGSIGTLASDILPPAAVLPDGAWPEGEFCPPLWREADIRAMVAAQRQPVAPDAVIGEGK